MQELKYRMTDGFDLRFMAGGYVLMPAGRNLADDAKKPLMLDEVTAFVIRKIQEKSRAREELLSALLDEYEVEKEEAAASLEAVLRVMCGKGVLTEEAEA